MQIQGDSVDEGLEIQHLGSCNGYDRMICGDPGRVTEMRMPPVVVLFKILSGNTLRAQQTSGGIQ